MVQRPLQKAPKQKQEFWIVFGITAGILILIAIALRINADNTPSVEFIYSTPVTGNSTYIKFYKSATTPHPGVNGNPWGYDFDGSTGDYIDNEIPQNFCRYFKCTSDFWTDNRNGYIVECNDGEYTRTGGYASACDGHGGVDRPLYWHP